MNKKYFLCKNCGKNVSLSATGTHNRNHCPYCLWSLHVDIKKPGDRKSDCMGLIEPVGLTFKHEGPDKYGKERQGEIMLVHQCSICNKYSINRLAGDDDPKTLLSILEKTTLPNVLSDINQSSIELLTGKDKEEVEKQLFGKKSNTGDSKKQ